MNLYVYFASPYLSSYKVPRFVQNQADALILDVKNSPLPLRQQQSILYTLIQSLHQANQYDFKTAQEKANLAFQQARDSLQKAIEAQSKDSSFLLAFSAKHPLLLRYSDLLAFFALWIGGYQALVGSILENHSIWATMPFGFSNFLQAFSGYVCIKLTLDVLLCLEGPKRWLCLASLFILYLALMKWSNSLLGVVLIPAINVILICVLIFFISLVFFVQVYGKPIRSEN